MFVHPHPARSRGPLMPIAAALAVLLAVGDASAQTDTARQVPDPAATEAAAQRAYAGLDWTGRPAATATLRKEAGAARVEGRRSCLRSSAGAERQSCLQTVDQDYRSMLDRIRMRSAGR